MADEAHVMTIDEAAEESKKIYYYNAEQNTDLVASIAAIIRVLAGESSIEQESAYLPNIKYQSPKEGGAPRYAQLEKELTGIEFRRPYPRESWSVASLRTGFRHNTPVSRLLASISKEQIDSVHIIFQERDEKSQDIDGVKLFRHKFYYASKKTNIRVAVTFYEPVTLNKKENLYPPSFLRVDFEAK